MYICIIAIFLFLYYVLMETDVMEYLFCCHFCVSFARKNGNFYFLICDSDKINVFLPSSGDDAVYCGPSVINCCYRRACILRALIT